MVLVGLFGLRIPPKSTVEALLLPLFGHFLSEARHAEEETGARVPTLSVGSSCLLRLRDYLFSYSFWLAPLR